MKLTVFLIVAVLISVLALVVMVGVANAELIPSEYQQFHGTYVNYPGIGNIAPGWTPYGTPILAANNTWNATGWQFPSQSQFLYTNSSGGIMINVTTVPGQIYNISVWLYLCNGTVRQYVYPDGLGTAGSVMNASTTWGWQWINMSVAAGATGPMTLLIRGNGASNNMYVTYASISSPADPAGPAPVAAFTSDVTQGWSTFVVSFTDQSTGSPTSWEWNFGDDTADSIEQNPQHVYDHAGTFTVSLKVTNENGNDTETKVGYIYAPLVIGPSASFTTNVTTGYPPLCVQFTGASTGDPVTGWNWDFNYNTGYDSSVQSPVYTYTQPGTYTVRLYVTSANGSSGVTNQNLIVVNALPPTPTPKYISPIALPTADPSFKPHAINTSAYTSLMNHTVANGTNFTMLFSAQGVGNVMSDLGLPFVTALGGGSRGNSMFLFFIVGLLMIVVFWRTRSVFYASALALVSCPILWAYVPFEYRTGILAMIVLGVTGIVYSMLVNSKRD